MLRGSVLARMRMGNTIGISKRFYSVQSIAYNDVTLDNGIRVAAESKAGQTAAISVVMNTGSGHETEVNNGVAHFLEHLAFKVSYGFKGM